MNKISVIIPIYNAMQFLPGLFESLDSQNFINGDEIILIDNGSTDGTSEFCIQHAKENSHYKYLFFDTVADSYAARNYGIANSASEILAFTDSDCKPCPKWLDEIRTITEGKVYGGKIELEVVDKSNIWEIFDQNAHLGKSKSEIDRHCVPTANMAVLRSDFVKIGNFMERFSGGDYEWSKRAYGFGMEIVFKDTAKIIHPTRKKFEEIMTRERRTAYGSGKAWKECKRKKWLIIIIYFLRIFKIDTNIKYCRYFYHEGLGIKKMAEFNKGYFKIRIEQMKAAKAGYEGKNARELGIK